jgi:hypothetical protein
MGSPGGAGKPGGIAVIPGGTAGTKSVDIGRIAGDSGVASCEPEPRSDSTATEEAGDRGGCGDCDNSFCLSVFTSAVAAGF